MNEEFIIVRKVLRLGNRLISTRNQSLKEHHLTAEQWDTLQFLDTNVGASASELNEHLHISHQAARTIIERMKKKDLLYSTVSSEDARVRPIFLTEKGKEVCAIIKNEGTNMGHVILNGLSVEEKETFHSLLNKISNNL